MVHCRGGGTNAPLTPLFHRPCYDVALSLNPNLAVEKISIHISYFFMTLIGEREKIHATPVGNTSCDG